MMIFMQNCSEKLVCSIRRFVRIKLDDRTILPNQDEKKVVYQINDELVKDKKRVGHSFYRVADSFCTLTS